MTRQERRKAMPECTAVIDSMRQHFPGLRVLYASENGHKWGERSAEGIPATEMVIEKAA